LSSARGNNKEGSRNSEREERKKGQKKGEGTARAKDGKTSPTWRLYQKTTGGRILGLSEKVKVHARMDFQYVKENKKFGGGGERKG